jgi:hypothetical protein
MIMLAVISQHVLKQEVMVELSQKISVEECKRLWRIACAADPLNDGLLPYVEVALNFGEGAKFLEERLSPEAIVYLAHAMEHDVQNRDKTNVVNFVAVLLKEQAQRH